MAEVVTEAVLTPRREAKVSVPWTLLIYLAGDNNLDRAGLRDLLELKSAASSAVHVVAQLDRLGRGVTRRYFLTPDRPLDDDVVAELPETNTGDPAVLLDFVLWGLQVSPADRTALVLWNHGAGWKDDDVYAHARRAEIPGEFWPSSQRGDRAPPASRALFLPSLPTLLNVPAMLRGVLFDDTAKDFLDNQELAAVLAQVVAARGGRKLDLIGFDACLMSMVEVAYQVHDCCDVLVGSQEIEPADGWPYGRILSALAADPEMAPEQLGRAIVRAYADGFPPPPSPRAWR